MGFNFKKSFKVAPGVKLNLNKKSTSVSIGGKGLKHTINSKGKSRTTVGLPGTGISYSTTSGGKKKKVTKTSKSSTAPKKQHTRQTYVEKVVLDENAVNVCPNCGATVRGSECPYCGTPLDVGTKKVHEVKEEQFDIPELKQKVNKSSFRKRHPILFWFCMLCVWPFALGWWFYKTDMFNLSKRTRLIILAVFYILCFIFGGSNETESTNITTKEIDKFGVQNESQPEKEEIIEKIPLSKCEIFEETVYKDDETHEDIGKRAYVEFAESDFKGLSDKEIADFSLSVVKKYEDQDYNYFTIDFGNGRGAVFPACTCFPIEIGQIDNKGTMKQIERYIYVDEDGKVERHSKTKEEIQAEEEERARIAEEKAKKEAEEKAKAAEEEARKEQEKREKEAEEEQARLEKEAQEQAEREAARNNRTVYISAKGLQHSKNNCSGMKYYTTMTYGESVAYGYRPCEKCGYAW